MHSNCLPTGCWPRPLQVTPLPDNSATYTEPHPHPHSNPLLAGARPAPSARVRPPSPRWWRCSPTTGAALHGRLPPCYCRSHPAALLTAACSLAQLPRLWGRGCQWCRGCASCRPGQHTQQAAAAVVHAASWPLFSHPIRRWRVHLNVGRSVDAILAGRCGRASVPARVSVRSSSGLVRGLLLGGQALQPTLAAAAVMGAMKARSAVPFQDALHMPHVL